MTTFKSKLPNTGTTIFSVMSQLAAAHQAINLSQGFPNFKSDQKLTDLVSNAMNSGHNQYAPMPGLPALNKTIAEKINALYNATYHPETEITVTAGATQAIFTIISAFINKDDEVIIFSPAYDCYEPAITLNSGKTISVNLHYPNYQIPWDEVKEKFSEKTKMIIINTPHNPCGSILSESDMKQLEALTTNTNCIVLSDEVYEHIIFDGHQHHSIAKFPELRKRSFLVASFGKTFHNTGWKIGYCAAPKTLMEEFRKVHQFNVFCVNHPMQHALAAYLQNAEHYLSLSSFYQEKRDLFLEGIKDSRFSFVPAKGTYFQLLCYKNISDEKDVDFAKKLTRENKIASIPVSVFYPLNHDHKVLRFCFANTDETLKKATEIVCNI